MTGRIGFALIEPMPPHSHSGKGLPTVCGMKYGTITPMIWTLLMISAIGA